MLLFKGTSRQVLALRREGGLTVTVTLDVGSYFTSYAHTATGTIPRSEASRLNGLGASEGASRYKDGMKPWQTLERVETPEGPLELRRRGERDFLITIAGRVLMTSAAHRSEDDLARLACAAMVKRPRPRVILGGLGMGYTLRAALDLLPAAAEVTVVDLNPTVVAWCRGPLAPLTDAAVDDRRVSILVDDVARVIATARSGECDAILLDLYEGPRPSRAWGRDPLYGDAAVDAAWLALRAGGVLAVWAEEADPSYEARLRRLGFRVDVHRGGGRGGRAHIIYMGVQSARISFASSR